MTDNEIIKALECCSTDGRTCEECPYDGQTTNEIFCDEKLQADALELIKTYKECMAEVIKEFAEKLKENSGSSVMSDNGVEIYSTKQYNINAVTLDNLVKEMVGADNGLL